MRKVWKIKEIQSFITQYLDQRKDLEDDFILTIKKKKKTRTLQENKLFHVLFEIIREQEEKLWNKYSFDEIKNIMKLALIWVKEIQFWKFMIQYPLKWTSELTIEEWIDFIEKMILWCNTKYFIEEKDKIKSKDDIRLFEYRDQYIQ